jgi:hypothetical protein
MIGYCDHTSLGDVWNFEQAQLYRYGREAVGAEQYH